MTELVAVASGTDPNEVRPFIERIQTLERELREQAHEHALIVAHIEAERDTERERCMDLMRQLRVYQQAEQQTEGE